MVEVHAVYLVLGALGVFLIGTCYGRAMLLAFLLYPRYWWWRVARGMRKLLERVEAGTLTRMTLAQLMNLAPQMACRERVSRLYWIYLPELLGQERPLPDTTVAVGTELIVAPLGEPKALLKQFGIEDGEKAPIFPLQISFIHTMMYPAEQMKFVCHTSMSQQFLAFCRFVLGWRVCAQCGADFAAPNFVAPSGMQANQHDAVQRIVAQFEAGMRPLNTSFVAVENMDDESSALCTVNGGMLYLEVFCGEAHAVEFIGKVSERRFKEVTFTVVKEKTAAK